MTSVTSISTTRVDAGGVPPEPKFTPLPPPLQLTSGAISHFAVGIYLHIPFCFHKCHYCDFYSLAEPAEAGDRQAVFVERLIAELHRRSGQIRLEPRTLFVGGGTPTLLRVELWDRLLGALRDLELLDQASEFTVEANPETVAPELLAVLRRGGVNRVSIGAQSFDPRALKVLERWHDVPSVARAVQQCRDAGIDNINLDLIFAIPGQTLADVDADLDAALALEPTHLSCYSLMYEPNTALTQRLRLGQIGRVDEELEAQMYERVMDRLAAAGFEQYEISNWSRPGRRCQHNLLYWHNEPWLGVGPSASSHVAGWRWKNVAHLGRYLASSDDPPITDVEHLPPQRHAGEALMLRLRLRDGAPLDWLQAQLGPEDERWRVIDELVELGLLERAPTHLRLTRRGLMLADAVTGKLL